MDGQPAVGRVVVIQVGQQCLSECRGILGPDDRRKLVAAEAPNHRVRSHASLQPLDDRTQQSVSGRVAGGLVDLTEVVEIDQQQGGGTVRRRVVGDPVQPPTKRSA